MLCLCEKRAYGKKIGLPHTCMHSMLQLLIRRLGYLHILCMHTYIHMYIYVNFCLHLHLQEKSDIHMYMYKHTCIHTYRHIYIITSIPAIPTYLHICILRTCLVA